MLLPELPQDDLLWVSHRPRPNLTSRSLNLKTSPDEVTVTKGTPKVYNDASTRSGKPMARSFCGDCGTPLWSDPSAAPGVRYLKVGTLDDAEGVDLKMELFVDKAIPCTVHPKGSQTQLDSKMQPV